MRDILYLNNAGEWFHISNMRIYDDEANRQARAEVDRLNAEAKPRVEGDKIVFTFHTFFPSVQMEVEKLEQNKRDK